MSRFFSLLRYSIGNEDWRTEEEALNIQLHDTVLCITASGDRPLNLLNRECQKIVCIDANAAQNHLLELKAASMRILEYKDYLEFLGAASGGNRLNTLQAILPHLPPKTAAFWMRHVKMVEKGVLYQGSMERLTGILAKIFSLTRGSKVNKLFSMNNLEEQQKFVRSEWDSYLWRKTFSLFLNPLISRFIIQDPGLANIGSGIRAGDYIYKRINGSLDRELANKNLLLSLILRGKVSQDAFSPYLTKEGTESIKKRLSSLEIHTGNVLDYLESCSTPAFDVFSLSDIASYMSYSNFVRLLKNMIRTAKPGARFCLRQFLSSYEIPLDLQPYFSRDEALEKKLEQKDNCFVYRFMVGTVVQAPVLAHVH